MIKRVVVPFEPNEILSISQNDYFEIINAELNTPQFGDLTLHLLCSDSESSGKYIANYIVAEENVELPISISPIVDTNKHGMYWRCITDLTDSVGKTYFLLAHR